MIKSLIFIIEPLDKYAAMFVHGKQFELLNEKIFTLGLRRHDDKGKGETRGRELGGLPRGQPHPGANVIKPFTAINYDFLQ
jgi:hypothetical protein